MLTKYLYGTIIHNLEDIGFTKEAIIEKYHEALPHQNVAFKFSGVTVETIDEGNHIQISEQHPEKDWYHTVKFDALKFKTVEEFADLVLNYSDEKVKSEYEKDMKQSMKHLIDSLDIGEKEDLLLNLLSAKI